MDYLIILLFNIIFIFYNIDNVSAKSMVPVLSLDANKNKKANKTLKENEGLKVRDRRVRQHVWPT